MTRGTEGVVDVEDLRCARSDGRAELVDESRGQTQSLPFARCILEPRDRRLRGERQARLGTALDGELHERVVAEAVEIGAVAVAAGDRHGAHADELGHRVHDAGRIAIVGHRCGEPLADAEPRLSLAKEQQTAVGRLVAAGEIYCELLAGDGWQIEWQWRILGHGGCGVRCGYAGTRGRTRLLRESRPLRHNRHTVSQHRCMIRVRPRAKPGGERDHNEATRFQLHLWGIGREANIRAAEPALRKAF